MLKPAHLCVSGQESGSSHLAPSPTSPGGHRPHTWPVLPPIRTFTHATPGQHGEEAHGSRAAVHFAPLPSYPGGHAPHLARVRVLWHVTPGWHGLCRAQWSGRHVSPSPVMLAGHAPHV